MKKFWLLLLSVFTLVLMLTATVFAAECDFTVTTPGYTYYGKTSSKIEPTVTANGVTLTKNTDYTLTYKNTDSVGTASVTVTGRGNWAGITKTSTYQILRQDISKALCSAEAVTFFGMEATPNISVSYQGKTLIKDTDYKLFYESNCNVGTGYARVVGIGNFFGCLTVPFEISLASKLVDVEGNYIGQADGTLDPNAYYYSELLACPTYLTVRLNTATQHAAYYELYRIEGEEAVLVTTYESPFGNNRHTAFSYNFYSVYENAVDAGGEVYLLSYTWVDSYLSVYCGICAIAVPAKVADATSMSIERIPNTNDPLRDYFTVCGTDGHVGTVSWSVSDPSIATVENGVLTKLAPGTVTVTATYGNLSASMDVTIEAHDLRDAQILAYDPETAQATIAYNNILLTAEKEYTCSVETNGGILETTATGKHNFYGYIMRQFDSVTGAPIGHTHTFRDVCSEGCSACSFTRACSHTKGTQLTRDRSGHWYLCTLCGGGKTDYAAHIPSAEDPEVCTVCGPLNIPGDLNEDVNLNDADALYLLRHTLFPTRYPVIKDADVNKDGEVNDADALYLLRHTLFPTRYPLYPV